jgi:transcriptional regulator with XRE-family HTH domain
MFSGAKLRSYRQRAGKTQEALALELGITSAYLSNIENSKRTPSHKIMEAMAQSLSIDIRDLWENDGTLPPIPINATERGIVIEVGDGASKMRCILPSTHETYLFISRQIAEMKNEADPRLRELLDFWERSDERNKERILTFARGGNN